MLEFKAEAEQGIRALREEAEGEIRALKEGLVMLQPL